jgi:hypothetical protein
MPKPDYDTTLAHVAGNIAGMIWATPKPAGTVGASLQRTPQEVARYAVLLARAIVAEVRRTEPQRAETESRGVAEHDHYFGNYVVCQICGQTEAALTDCHHCGDPTSLKNGRCWHCLRPVSKESR